ncbi:MAG: glycosyltransferase [Hyphomonadaceae bacterium]
MAQQSGFDVCAAAFERPSHKGRPPSCPVSTLGHIEHGRYLARLLKMIVALPALRAAVSRTDIVYASGLEMALMALIAGFGLKRPIVIEIGDIRGIQVRRGLLGELVRWFDKRIVDACSLLVATSPSFVHQYYRRRLKSRVPALIVENKLEPSSANAPVLRRAPMSANQPLRIGYFGVLRCEWSWQMLSEMARLDPSIEIVLAGIPLAPANLAEMVRERPNIRYLGTYRSPQDLADLYAQVDIVWACYPPPTGDAEWRWAQKICRTNRFYECCAFGTPIIAIENTDDADAVAHFDIGLVATDDLVNDPRALIAQIDNQRLDHWRDQLRCLPRSIYEYSSEASELATSIVALHQRALRLTASPKGSQSS